MHFTNAVKCVQEESSCTDESAAKQLITAIVDQKLAARWEGVVELEPVIPSEFRGILKICLDGVGVVKRNCPTAKIKSIAHWSRNCPKLQFVNGPVFDDFQDVPLTENLPYAEVSTLTYIPLLVLKEDIDRWPLEDSGSAPTKREVWVLDTVKQGAKVLSNLPAAGVETDSKVPNTGDKTRITRPPPPSEKKILEVARKVYRENQTCPPNLVQAQKLIRKELPGARRKAMLPILKCPEFVRRPAGKQPE